MATYSQVLKQISGDPCSRSRKASVEQLRLIARLILECEGRPGFRWDYSHPEAFTAFRAKQMIESLRRAAEQVPA